jgi:hypothetical protein
MDLSRFKVVYGEKVLHAISLQGVELDGDYEKRKQNTINKPKCLTILAINEDGNIIEIHDEAWMFQFIPIVHK